MMTMMTMMTAVVNGRLVALLHTAPCAPRQRKIYISVQIQNVKTSQSAATQDGIESKKRGKSEAEASMPSVTQTPHSSRTPQTAKNSWDDARATTLRTATTSASVAFTTLNSLWNC